MAGGNTHLLVCEYLGILVKSVSMKLQNSFNFSTLTAHQAVTPRDVVEKFVYQKGRDRSHDFYVTSVVLHGGKHSGAAFFHFTS